MTTTALTWWKRFVRHAVETAFKERIAKHGFIHAPDIAVSVADDRVAVSVRAYETSIDVNIIWDVFYLLFVEIGEAARGRGKGSAIYERMEAIARDLGCRRIEQTPSGWCPNGETRAAYLARRGWVLEGEIAYKDLTK